MGPRRQIDRQVHVPAVGKFQISQVDTKTPVTSAAAFDHVAGTDWEPVWKTVCQRSHDIISCKLPRRPT
jgi:hypothetical protein